MISHNLNEKKLDYSYYFINIALLGMSLDWLFVQSSFGVYIYWLLFAIGIGFFLSYVYEAYKTRLRRKLDVGLKYTVIAVSLLILPVLIAIVLIFTGQPTSFVLRVVSIYGFSIIFGVITMLILGQTYKTLPFIIWLDRYQAYVGKFKTPLPRELYSEKLADYQFYAYLIAVSLIVIGIIFKLIIILQIGSIVLILVALSNMANIIMMITHKTKIEKHTKSN